jgi:uncharacterized protein YgiM (DUF1202 family)
MTSTPRRAAAWRLGTIIVVALAVAASPLVSAPAVFAQSALYPGAVALVANTGGEPVLLRETPSFDAAVLSSFPEGTPADIIEGPVSSADGVAWFGVSVGGMTGYLVAGYLAESGQAAPAPETVELAQEAVPAETMAAETTPVDAVPAPAVSASEIPANPVPTADLNLRAGPSYDDAVLLVIPAGAPLTPTGEWSEGFAGVTYQGQYGWVDSSWLAAAEAAPQEVALMQEAAPAAAPQTAPVADAGVVGDLSTAPAGDIAYAADTANLRLGPSEADEVLRVLPAGGAVTITGAASNGWTPVWYNGTWGFISSGLLTADGSASLQLFQEAVPAPEPLAAESAVEADTAEMQAVTTSDVNFRAAPDMTSAVLGAIPPGVALTPLAGPEQGFYQVAYNGQTGWIAAEYVEVSASYLQRGDRQRQQEGKVEGSEPASNAELGAGGIIWPVSGGLWYIMQGYHGSSHQNQDGLWQYEYSLDLARRDGNTAGQQVISPVNGIVRWTDPSTGGISIDIGNGHAVAMFHVDFMDGLEAGTNVQQGQYLGAISGPGGPGFAGTPHLHFTLWSSSDNGNWDRNAVPFTGQYAISGMDFPDSGGNSHQGVEFQP